MYNDSQYHFIFSAHNKLTSYIQYLVKPLAFLLVIFCGISSSLYAQTDYTSSLSGGDNPLSSVPETASGVITGDFDNDGDVDVLAFDDNGNFDSYNFYANDGSGAYSVVTGSSNPFDGIAASDIFFVGDHTYVADFDNDGDQDIWDYRGENANDNQNIYLENTGGSYTSSKAGGSNPLSGIPDADGGVIVGDFDSDSDIDVLAYDDDTYTSFSFFANNGSGYFSEVTGSSSPFNGITDGDIFFVADNTFVADFDGDGDQDIWDYRGENANDNQNIYLENTGGSYTSSIAGGSNPLSGIPDVATGVIVGDFDSDDDIDVLAYDDDTYSSFSFYANNGSGSFSEVTGSSNPFDGIADGNIFYAASNTLVADFDNDGDQDIWDYEGNGSNIYLKKQGSPNTAPTDITLSSNSINQSDGTNATVGNLTTTDADGGDTHSYSLVSGTGDTDNSSFNISGSDLRANDASNLASGSYSVRIQTDDGIDTYQKAFTITVNDDLAPNYENSTPSLSGTTVSQTTLTVRLNEIGTAYYVAVPDGDGAPSASQVKNGQNSSGSEALASGSITISSASQDFTDDITGLSSNTAYDIYVVSQDDEGTPNLQGSPTKVDVTTDAPDTDGSLTAAGGVSEPVGINSILDTSGEAVDVFDFTLSDGGGGDGFAMTVSEITVNVSGTATDTERNKITWRLNGNDASNVTGTYSTGSDQITFSGLSISVADGGSETYTVNAYYNDNTGLTEDRTIVLSVDGDTDVTTGAGGTSIGTTSAVTNGSGSTIDIDATQLAFTTQPANSTSGSALGTQPVIAAQDAFGNTDVDFSETVTLTESSVGSLSGDVDLAAVNGVATFTDVSYTATADQESFTLTANDQDGVGSNFSTVDANSVTSDVVATKLVFDTQPAPTILQSGITEDMTTDPVVQTVDANNIVDTGYSTDIQLSEVNGPGGATMTATGDTDGSAATVSVTPSSGVSTFNDLQLTYTASGGSNENFNLQASSGGLTSVNSTQLTAEENNPPTLTGLPSDITITEDTESNVDLSSSVFGDADGDNITVTLTASAGTFSTPADGAGVGAGVTETLVSSTVITLAGSPGDINTYLDTNSNIKYTGASNVNGDNAATISVEANDGNGSGDVSFGNTNIDITAVNDVPVVTTTGGATAFTEGDAAKVIDDGVTVSDLDNSGLASATVSITANLGSGDVLAFTNDGATMGNIGGSYNAGTGVLTLTSTGAIATPADFQNALRAVTYANSSASPTTASRTIAFVANDGVASSAAATKTVSVSGVNEAPSFSSMPVTAAKEGEAYSYAIEASDPDGDGLSFSGVEIPAWASLADNGDGTATLSGTPGPDDMGDATVELEVSDGTDTASQSFTITVDNTNRAPVFDSTPVTAAKEGQAYSYSVEASDPDGDAVTITPAQIPGWASLTDNGDGTAILEGTPGLDDAGDTAIELTVSDGTATIAQSFIITVGNTNRAPVFDSSPATKAQEQQAYTYNIVASDPDGDALTITAPTAPDWVSLTDNDDGTASLGGTPGPEDMGEVSVELQVSDGTVTATQSFTISVSNTNRPPVFDSSPVTAGKEGENYSYTVKASDPDGDGLSFSGVEIPVWANLQDNGDGTATLSGTPGPDDMGEVQVELEVSDGTDMATQSFTITVDNTNRAPVFDSQPVTSAKEGEAYSYAIQASDPDGDKVSLSAAELPDWADLQDNGDGTATLSGTPGPDDMGEVSVELEVSDGTATASQSFTITVGNTNRPPAFNSSPVTGA
ncbi:beta strand repeat-containing protein, partial [Fodinibius salsisoli]